MDEASNIAATARTLDPIGAILLFYPLRE